MGQQEPNHIYFLSDLHLKKMESKKAQNLLRFFSLLSEKQVNGSYASEVFLVGDVFDLWVGSHKYFVKKYQPLISTIRSYIVGGGQVHFFEGNHDLYLSKFWGESIGCNVVADPASFRRYGQHLYIEHGDQMNPDDRGYLFLRAFLRSKVMRWVQKILPGSVVNWIGERASETSRHHTHREGLEEEIKQLIEIHVEQLSCKHNFDLHISGHVHVRYEYLLKNKTAKAFNLGCWTESRFPLLELSKQGALWKDLKDII